MADLNRVFLLGRLTRDPTLRHTPGGTPVAEFGMAVNRNWTGPDGDRREETCFVDIVVWSRRAEVCNANLQKGSPIFVEGRLHLDTWSSASGEKRSRLKVVANNVVFLNPPPRGGHGTPPRSGEGRASPPESSTEAGPPPKREGAAETSGHADPSVENQSEPGGDIDFPF